MDERTDEELLEAIAAGPGALTEFYRRHVARMVAFGARRFTNAEDVADFVASVFLAVLESAARFDRRKGSGLGWLYGVATHVSARERTRIRRGEDVTAAIAGRRLLEPDDVDRIERQIDAAAHLRAVADAMRHLSDETRRLLELVAIDGLQPAEAADALGISRVAARVRLSRARRALRDGGPAQGSTLAREATS